MPRPISVSTLARFAANPEGFMSSDARRIAAMDRAAEHGIRWHERLATAPRRSRPWRWVLLLTLIATATLLILFG